MALFALACTPAADTPVSGAPTDLELASATYAGIEVQNPVTLTGGRWEGPPYTPQGASRPAVTLASQFRLEGDLDGDGVHEVVVLLTASGGGSGSLVYAAVVGRRDGTVRNLATTLLGDRVQIRDGRIAQGRVTLDLLEVGPSDPACCPGDLVSQTWALAGGQLVAVSRSTAERMSLHALEGPRWVLRQWDLDEPVVSDPLIYAEFDGARISGTAGCNTYSGTAGHGPLPGDASFGPFLLTRMACPDSISAMESRYLELLANVTGVGFLTGRLALTYVRSGGTSGSLLFDRRSAHP
jgi:heat shock protein HslJ